MAVPVNLLSVDQTLSRLNRIMWRKIVLLTLLAILLAGLPLGFEARAGKAVAGEQESAEMVWIKPTGRGNAIMYSALLNSGWSTPVQLSDDGKTNLVPTIAGAGNNLTFVVWSVVNRGGSNLNFCILRNGVIIKGPEKIETGMSSNLAAFLAAGDDGVPWLVWSGNNGTTSDIYYAVWQDNHWLPPGKVHAWNSVPDILPRLEISQDGKILVTWNRFGPNGYMSLTEVLKPGKAAGAPKSVDPPAAAPEKGVGSPLDCVTVLPMDENMRDQAVLLSRCRKNSRPVQIRFGGKGLQARGITR